MNQTVWAQLYQTQSTFQKGHNKDQFKEKAYWTIVILPHGHQHNTKAHVQEKQHYIPNIRWTTLQHKYKLNNITKQISEEKHYKTNIRRKKLQNKYKEKNITKQI